MDQAELENLKKEGKIFQVGDSFPFAVQVRDPSGGCSHSRCSHCGNSAAFCEQICRACGLPFVGPAGLPDIQEWNKLTPEVKTMRAQNAFLGPRFGYANVINIPLNRWELAAVESLRGEEAATFKQAHGVSPDMIRFYLTRYDL